MDEVPIWVTEVPAGEESVKGMFTAEPEAVLRRLPAERLRDSLSAICGAVVGFLGDVKRVGSYRLKEIEIHVEVTAEGGVNLIGTTKLGGTGAIKLTFAE